MVQESGLSRYPVFDESIDNIIGVVLAKDLLKVLAPRTNLDAFDLPSIMRPVHVIPGSREVEEVLADFKRLKEHMAIVLDEYGGTAGIVTMEDLLEEIVGEILDGTTPPKTPKRHAPARRDAGAGQHPIGELTRAVRSHRFRRGLTTIGGSSSVLGRCRSSAIAS